MPDTSTKTDFERLPEPDDVVRIRLGNVVPADLKLGRSGGRAHRSARRPGEFTLTMRRSAPSVRGLALEARGMDTADFPVAKMAVLPT